MMSRAIPEEIIAMILAYALYASPERIRGTNRPRGGPAAIVPFARVSAIWRAEVERLLYDHISLIGPRRIVACFRTIAYGRRGVGKYVKCLHINLQDYDTTFPPRRLRHGTAATRGSAGRTGDDGRLLMAFARVVHDALFAMKQLSSYNLCIGRTVSHGLTPRAIKSNKFAFPFLPVNAPFKLQSFFCSGLTLSAQLVRFLRDQMTITRLEAPGLNSKYRLNNPVLPNLRSLSGPVGLIRRNVPGRPVVSVRCTNSVVDGAFLGLVERLQQSSTPLKQFIFPSVFVSAARNFLPVISTKLPHLETLVMSDHIPSPATAAEEMTPYQMYKDDAFLHSLGQFKELKDLTVYANPISAAGFPPYSMSDLVPEPTDPPVGNQVAELFPNLGTMLDAALAAEPTWDGEEDEGMPALEPIHHHAGPVPAPAPPPNGVEPMDIDAAGAVPPVPAPAAQPSAQGLTPPAPAVGVAQPPPQVFQLVNDMWVPQHQIGLGANVPAPNAGPPPPLPPGLPPANNANGAVPPPPPGFPGALWNQIMGLFGVAAAQGAGQGAPQPFNGPPGNLPPNAAPPLPFPPPPPPPVAAGPPPMLQVLPPPLNANGAANLPPGINVTVNFAPGVNAEALGPALLQHIEGVTAQLLTQMVNGQGAGGTTAPRPQEELDEDMIYEEDPPVTGEEGGFGGFGAQAGAFLGGVQIDAIVQMGPGLVPPGHLGAAAPAPVVWPAPPPGAAAPVPQPPPPAGGPVLPNFGIPPLLGMGPLPVFAPIPMPAPAPPAANPPPAPAAAAEPLPWLDLAQPAAAGPQPPPNAQHNVAGIPPPPPPPIFPAVLPMAIPAGPPPAPGAAPAPPAAPAAHTALHLLPQFFNPSTPESRHFRAYERAHKQRCDKWQRDQAPEERSVLELWSAYCPTLQRVTFEMDFGRHVVWKRRGESWRPTYTPSSAAPPRKKPTTVPPQPITSPVPVASPPVPPVAA